MTDEQPWLSLTEAARVTGLDREAIRSRARRGLVPSQKNNKGELLVQVPADLVAAPDQGVTGEVTARDTAMADLVAEVTELRTTIAQLEAGQASVRAAAAAGVAAAQRITEETIMARNDLVDELRRGLEREQARADRLEAEARRPWWRRLVGAVLLVGLASAGGAQPAMAQGGGVSVYGWGREGCGRFLDIRRAGEGEVAEQLRHWVMGYVTAYNIHGDGDGNVTDGADDSTILALVERECLADPRQVIAFAVMKAVLGEETRR